ncbi:MAG: NCS2 family permease [Dethiobacter sp.]|nr:NCS2 family permease [Dethiobacter sp.]
MERLFKLKENNTNVRTELFAGLTTFITMAYIIFVNPAILSNAGMDFGAVLVATCIASALATLMMGLIANYPFALAPGMGLNAYFTFTVALGLGLGYEAALAAVFISGLMFILLTVTRGREAIINSIPMSLKLAVGAGIGLFIAFIGFKSAGIIVPYEPTLVKLGDMSDPKVLLAVFGLLLTSILVVKKVRGSLLIGILITTIAGMIFRITPAPASFAALFSAPPSLKHFGDFAVGMDSLFKLGFAAIPIIFSFAFVDVFDTVGTLTGVASKAKMLDQDGKLPRVNRAFVADAVGTVAGAALGTSTVTTYIESAAGVAEGGRTGLTAVVTGVLFLAALFISPLAALVPAQATAPILIIVGVFMMEPIMKINFEDYIEAIPAFFAFVMMPFTFNIAEGIVWGILAYVALNLAVRRFDRISSTMYILSALFVLRFILR